MSSSANRPICPTMCDGRHTSPYIHIAFVSLLPRAFVGRIAVLLQSHYHFHLTIKLCCVASLIAIVIGTNFAPRSSNLLALVRSGTKHTPLRFIHRIPPIPRHNCVIITFEMLADHLFHCGHLPVVIRCWWTFLKL